MPRSHFTKAEKALQREAAILLNKDYEAGAQKMVEDLQKADTERAKKEREALDEEYWNLCDAAQASLFADIAVARNTMKRPDGEDSLAWLGRTQYDTMLACCKALYRFVVAPAPTDADRAIMPAFMHLYWLHEGLSDEEKLIALNMKASHGMVVHMIQSILWEEILYDRPNVAFLTLWQSIARGVMPSKFVLEVIDSLIYKQREKLYDHFLTVVEDRKRRRTPRVSN